MKQCDLFYEINYNKKTYFSYFLGVMESPKHNIYLYNLDTKINDGKVHTLSHHSIERLVNNDQELIRRYLKC